MSLRRRGLVAIVGTAAFAWGAAALWGPRWSWVEVPILLLMAAGAARWLAAPFAGVDPLAGDGAPCRELEPAWSAMRVAQRGLLDRIEALDAVRGTLESAVSGTREGLALVGTDRRVLLVNRAFEELFESGHDPVGRLLAETVRDPEVLSALDAATEGEPRPSEAVLRHAASGRSFEVRVTPVDGGGAVVVFLDITGLERLERVRQDFVANVSHELRTPLASIKAFTETLLDGGLEDPRHARAFLETVRKSAGRMEALVDDLTDLSQIESGAVTLDCEAVDAAEIAREVAQQLSHRHAARGIDVRADFSEAFHVRADRRRLEQILVNLVDNAIKFGRPGGHVRLYGGRVEARDWIAVEDDGVGIAPDDLVRVFERFYRVDRGRSREAGGTGLGLAIVKHLTRLHGGSVRATSELGRGATFTVELPRVGDRAAVAGCLR